MLRGNEKKIKDSFKRSKYLWSQDDLLPDLNEQASVWKLSIEWQLVFID
jgi:hypothetical protein